jgi:hypothetical protein
MVRSPDSTGKALGVVVFIIGVLLLITVFVLAYRDLIAADDASLFTRLVNLPMALLFKGALLFIMGVVASAIANKGIAIYQASRGSEQP